MSDSDSERTPQGTARVNSRRFDTELAAVWYAANYYYQASWNRGREYIGVVFYDPSANSSDRYGITVNGNGGFGSSRVRIGDVPRGTIPRAVWHTQALEQSPAVSYEIQKIAALRAAQTNSAE